MFAVALWSLEDGGLIRISVVEEEVETSRRLRDPVRVYSLWFSLGSHSASPMPTGLEAVLLSALEPEERRLHELLVKGGPTILPINGMIVPAQREALKLGLLRREERRHRPPRCLQWSESLPDYVGVDDRIAELEESLWHLNDRLGAWSEANKVKWNALTSECSKALRQVRPAPRAVRLVR
jgi:hypothetical protein